MKATLCCCVSPCTCVWASCLAWYQATREVLKNDNNGEDGEKKKRTEDLRFRSGSTVRKKKWEMPSCQVRRAHTRRGKFTSRDSSRGVAHHHRLSMDEQSVIRYSLQVAFEQSYIFHRYLFSPYSRLPRPAVCASTPRRPWTVCAGRDTIHVRGERILKQQSWLSSSLRFVLSSPLYFSLSIFFFPFYDQVSGIRGCRGIGASRDTAGPWR